MMPMASSAASAGDNMISIHVYDPRAKLDHTFKCSKEILATRVGYFANQITHGRLTIENCDLCLFDWLMRWANGEEPTFARTNVLRILLMASFLRNGLLVRKCLDFCIEEKVDLSSLTDSELIQLAPHMSVCHLESLDGLNGRKVLGRLFYVQLEAWTNASDPLVGNFCDLARLYRCTKCMSLVHRDKPSTTGCVHEEDTLWNIQEYLEGLHKENKSWQKVYWQVWGQVHFFLCSNCHVCVAAQHISQGEEFDAKHPLGSFACCGQKIYNRDFLHNVESYVSKSLSPDDLCHVLYDTLGTYLSRVTGNKKQSNLVKVEETHTSWPMIDMSRIWKADELSVIQRRISYCTDPLNEYFEDNNNNDNISCKDESDNEDTLLWKQRINKWFDGNRNMSTSPTQSVIEEMPTSSPKQSVIEEELKDNTQTNQTSLEVMFKNMCSVGPFGDSLGLNDEQLSFINMDVNAKSEIHSGVITDDEKRISHAERANSGTPVETQVDGDSPSNDSAIKMGEDNYHIEGCDMGAMTISDDAFNASDQPSDGSERHISNFETEDSNLSSDSEEGEDEEGETQLDEEDTSEEPILLHDRRPSQVSYLKSDAGFKVRNKHEQHYNWKPNLSVAHNQMNQYDYELYKNEEIINYLRSKIYNIPKVKHGINSLSHDEEAARSQWLTHIIPREGTYSRIEEERIGPRAHSNRPESTTDFEEFDTCAGIPCEISNPL